jgi:hypothetical protein
MEVGEGSRISTPMAVDPLGGAAKTAQYLSTSAPPGAGDPDPFPALKSPLKAIQLYPPAGRSI